MNPANLINYIKTLFSEKIWDMSILDDKSPLGRFYAFLRVCSITINGTFKNKVISQAAALSYYTMIALGPLIAIVVLVSGIVIQGQHGEVKAEDLNKIISFISVPTGLSNSAPDNGTQSDQVNPEITNMLNHIIKSAQSEAVGVLGSVALIIIVIQLIISIENSLNVIWGVSRGRNTFQRLIYYWCLISLGTILIIVAFSLISANTYVSMVSELPFGNWLIYFIQFVAPFLAIGIIIALLTSFYRLMPNTFVPWKAALIGATLTTILLYTNNKISFIYVSKVVQSQSLYGSIGVIPVLMFGLYIFWFLILLGGQMTYAVQSVRFIASIKAWQNVSLHAKEAVSLAAIMLISRRFNECKKPYSLIKLSHNLRVPSRLLNGCLEQLCKTGLINPLEQNESIGKEESCYQPGRPLSKVTLGEIKNELENSGNNAGIDLIDDLDPVVTNYSKWLKQAYSENNILKKDIEQLIEEYPVPRIN